MNIRTKILAPVIGATLVMLMSSFFSIFKLEQLLAEYDDLLQQDVHQAEHIAATNILFKDQVQAWKNVLIRSGEKEKYWQQFTQYQQEIQSSLNQSQQYHSLRQTHANLFTRYRSAYQALANGDAPSNVDASIRGIDRAYSNELSKIIADKQRRVEQTQEMIKGKQNTITVVYPLIAIVLSIASVLLILFLLNLLIVTPLRQLISDIKEISNGKYDIDLTYDKDDELGELRTAATEIKSHIVDTVSSISLVKMDVETAFSLLREVSQQISEGSDEQLNCSQKMEAIIEDLVNIAEELAMQSDNALDSTNTVLGKANHCNQQINISSNDMLALSQQIGATSQIVKDLENEAGSVSSVLDVITTIAEQTNLLALNAAIEAARAGEAGRGFAVVADEVRLLATKTQESTLNISQIIQSLQQAAQQAVEAMEKSEHITDKNREQSNQVKLSLNEISEEMNTMASQSQLVSDISSRQVAINNQLNETLLQLKQVTDNYQEIANSSSVSDSVNKATEDLNQMVLKLTGNLIHQEAELF